MSGRAHETNKKYYKNTKSRINRYAFHNKYYLKRQWAVCPNFNQKFAGAMITSADNTDRSSALCPGPPAGFMDGRTTFTRHGKWLFPETPDCTKTDEAVRCWHWALSADGVLGD